MCFIYLRTHESYDKYNIYKLGKTTNIIQRNSVYKTGEPEPGYFKYIYQINCNKDFLGIVENLLKEEFKQGIIIEFCI